MIDKQQLAIDAIRKGRDVCLAASAGTGKSWTISQVKTKNTVIIAPTAVAACNIGGMTAHSAFSLSLGLQTEKDIKRITPTMRLLFGPDSKIDLLVFEEAFNLRSDLFDVIDIKLRKIRDNNTPFGGLQILLAGDASQNSPIVGTEELPHFRKKYLSPFIFNSRVWKELDMDIFVFDKVYRNENLDQLLMLQAIRMKDETIREGSIKPLWQEAIDYVNEIAEHGDRQGVDLYLTTYKKDSEKINEKHYKELGTKEFIYKAEIIGKFKTKDASVPLELKLKVGAKVMFVVNNYELGFYNGTTGTVLELDEHRITIQTADGNIYLDERHEWETVKYSSLMGDITKIVEGSMKQFPLMLAYSATISKVQGCTLNSATINFGYKCFGEGMLYVALSRLRDLKNLTLARPILYSDLNVNPRAIKFIKKHS